MRRAGQYIIAIAVLKVGLACFILEGTGDATSSLSMAGLRGDSTPGNLFNPAVRGCNRIPCGVKFNNQPAKSRLVIDESASISSSAKVIVAGKGGAITYELKYGSNPEFASGRPGFQLGEPSIVAVDGKTLFVNTFKIVPSFNFDATIQIAYSSSNNQKNSTYYQCIDVHVISKNNIPVGIQEFGPELATRIPGSEGIFLLPGQTKRTNVAFIVIVVILAVLVAVFIAAAGWLFWKKKQLGPSDPVGEPVIYTQVEPSPPTPIVALYSTPSKDTPATTVQESIKSSNEPVAHIHYPDPESKESTSQSQDPRDGTGSQGRHFHFRYEDNEETKD